MGGRSERGHGTPVCPGFRPLSGTQAAAVSVAVVTPLSTQGGSMAGGRREWRPDLSGTKLARPVRPGSQNLV